MYHLYQLNAIDHPDVIEAIPEMIAAFLVFFAGIYSQRRKNGSEYNDVSLCRKCQSVNALIGASILHVHTSVHASRCCVVQELCDGDGASSESTAWQLSSMEQNSPRA